MAMRKKQSITIKEVAIQAGVSTATVSRVLTGKDAVSPKLRRRVDRAIEEMDYRPNRAARELRIGSVLKIGVVLSDIQNPFFTNCLAGVESVLQISDYVLLLGNSNEDPEIEDMHLSSLANEGVAGIILAMTAKNGNCYQKMVQMDIPIVAIDRECPDISFDTVLIDNITASRQATKHLVKLGHERIALISGPYHISTAQNRLKGFQEVLAELNIPCLPELIVEGNFQQEGGRKAMEQLLDLPEPPTAVLIANNLMTLGALEIIHQRNVQIPDQLALVGFDDTPWNIAMKTPLTVVAQPTYNLGEFAAKMLIDRINNPHLPKQKIMLEAELIIRDSCGYKKSRSST
jgi:DNA-binding LacI/PurR family transcriptional regulator